MVSQGSRLLCLRRETEETPGGLILAKLQTRGWLESGLAGFGEMQRKWKLILLVSPRRHKGTGRGRPELSAQWEDSCFQDTDLEEAGRDQGAGGSL